MYSNVTLIHHYNDIKSILKNIGHILWPTNIQVE